MKSQKYPDCNMWRLSYLFWCIWWFFRVWVWCQTWRYLFYWRI